VKVVKAGTVDVSAVIRIIDSTNGTPETGVVWNTAGIDLKYRREGAVSVDITEATLAALTTAHTDGGFLHIGNGYYRLDLPDAACAAGATGVLIHGTVTGMVVIGEYVQLVTYDPFDAVRLGLTALPNAAADAAGGLPISDAGGLDIDAKLANTNEVTAARMGALTDWINGGRLDVLLDAIPTTAMRGTDNAALAATALTNVTWTDARAGYLDAISGHTAQTGDTFALANGVAGFVAIDTVVDAVLVDTGTTLPASIAALPTAVENRTEMDSNSTQLTAIVADTNELQTDWANGGRLDLIADAILVDTGTTIPALIGALENISAAEVNSQCDTALTDYAGPTKTEMDTAHALLATPAQVNAQVLDVINVDTLVDGKTISVALAIIAAGVLGKISGAGTGTEVFVGLDGSTTRATVTVDASGNRSAVSY